MSANPKTVSIPTEANIFNRGVLQNLSPFLGAIFCWTSYCYLEWDCENDVFDVFVEMPQ